MTSELVTERHLSRQAVIYIRQSSPHQVLTNQESLRLQYALRQRALDLGWRDSDIDVIDADLGLSGAAAEHRQGFKDLIARVTLGEIGLILSVEVTRLTRNCSDWYPLLDLCGYRECLIADRDGVYDPGTQNGRLLLGLKGTISEMELHTLRGRLTAGLLNKARRGELALPLPTGLVRDPTGTVIMDPDREVQARIGLVFTTFFEKRTIYKVVRAFNAQGLTLPRRRPLAELGWRRPTVAAIKSILRNPAYAGAFVYGRTCTERAPLPAGGRITQRRRAPEEWKAIVKDRYPAYISWELHEKIGAMLHDNHADYRNKQTRGVPRGGAALLHGIAWCGECGHKLVVQYSNARRYRCNHLARQHDLPLCQSLPMDPIDAAVSEAFLEAVAPAEMEAWERARTAQSNARNAMEKAAAQQLERLRYQAALAERQYNRVDPDNRLVASELERRWEAALRELRDAERALAERRAANDQEIAPNVVELRTTFADAARRLSTLWRDARLTPARRKALLRCLIDKVVLRRKSAHEVALRIVWRGGETSNIDVDTGASVMHSLSVLKNLQLRVIELARQGLADREIADLLTAEGLRSPSCGHVLPATVERIRHQHGIRRRPEHHCPRRLIPGHLTVTQLAERLKVPSDWIYSRIYNGKIPVLRRANKTTYLFPDTPQVIAHIARLKDPQAEEADSTRPVRP